MWVVARRHVLNEYDRVDYVISFDAPRVCAPRFALFLARNRRLHFLGLGASNFFFPIELSTTAEHSTVAVRHR